jgi:hypothetical protein
MDAHKQATVSASFRCCHGWTGDLRSYGTEGDPASRKSVDPLERVVDEVETLSSSSDGEDGGSKSKEAERAAVEEHCVRKDEDGDTDGGNSSTPRQPGWRSDRVDTWETVVATAVVDNIPFLVCLF